jgi:hypothetical protein
MDVSFYVPKRALSERVRISMTATLFYYYSERSVLNGVLLDFRPDGLVFSKPSILQLEADLLEAADGDVLILYWYNPDKDLWEVEQKVKVDDGEVEFKIYHFSRYAISQKSLNPSCRGVRKKPRLCGASLFFRHSLILS